VGEGERARGRERGMRHAACGMRHEVGVKCSAFEVYGLMFRGLRAPFRGLGVKNPGFEFSLGPLKVLLALSPSRFVSRSLALPTEAMRRLGEGWPSYRHADTPHAVNYKGWASVNGLIF